VVTSEKTKTKGGDNILMTKHDLINIISKKAHLTKKDSREAIEGLFNEVITALGKGDKVVISGFGTFYISKVADKQVVPFGNEANRQTIKGHRVINFRVGKPLKKKIW
jgi:DNA-binding protein HU-beta